MSLHLVTAVGVVIGFLYLILVIELFSARRRNSARTKREERVESQWLPILVDEQAATPGELPAIASRDVLPFLTLWNQLQESFTGDITHHLNDVARRAGMDVKARRMLRQRSIRRRLLAVSTLGHLGDRQDLDTWKALVALTSHKDGLLSFAAARALTRIDAASALPVILPHISRRDDWSRNYVLAMLTDLGADVVSRPLTEAALRVPIEEAQRLLQYFAVAHVGDATPAVRSIIAGTDNVECVAACLRVFADVDDLATVREYLKHPSWRVRVQAVNVLARLGAADDYRFLLPLLSDPEWWVRYRTAKALCSLPGIEMAQVKNLSRKHDDPFARDMLVHVLAEAGA